MIPTIRDMRGKHVDAHFKLQDLSDRFELLRDPKFDPRKNNFIRGRIADPPSAGLDRIFEGDAQHEAIRMVSIMNNTIARARLALELVQMQANLAFAPEQDPGLVSALERCSQNDDDTFNALLGRADKIMNERGSPRIGVSLELGHYRDSIDLLHAQRLDIAFTPVADPEKTKQGIYDLRCAYVDRALNDAGHVLRRLGVMTGQVSHLRAVQQDGDDRESALTEARLEVLFSYWDAAKPELDHTLAAIDAYLGDLEPLGAAAGRDISRPARYAPLSLARIPEITP